MKKNIGKILLAVVVIILLAFVGTILFNRMSTEYKDLDETNQKILSEVDVYVKAEKKDPIWKDYELEKMPIVAIHGNLGEAFLINPRNEINSIFATKIQMPKDSAVTVYRLSPMTPQLLSLKIEPGKFNSIGKKYKIFGEEVYYVKYDKEESLNKKYTANHFMTFLSHEAFHYYMQNEWAEGGRFSGDLSSEDEKLIEKEYAVLGKIQIELLKNDPKKSDLKKYAKEYVAIMKQRINANPEYVKKEISMETAEGTATYIGIEASKRVEYDYGVMYFDNTKNVPFGHVMLAVKQGAFAKEDLADRMPYETGALLCQLLDAMEVKGWQEKLNGQTIKNPITLYQVISEAL